MKINFKNLEVYENYISNCNLIVDLLENKYKTFFIDRQSREKFFSVEDNTQGGDVLPVTKSYTDLYKMIFETISKEITPNYPDYITIYRYYPGSFLKRHKDPLVHKQAITDLIFLQAARNHFKIYTDDYPNGRLIEEIPGRRVIVAEDLEHEITLIEKDELTRYTMTMSWITSRPNITWWSQR
jgi:PIN domain nuclease of toxin-antitoxin system